MPSIIILPLFHQYLCLHLYLSVYRSTDIMTIISYWTL